MIAKVYLVGMLALVTCVGAGCQLGKAIPRETNNTDFYVSSLINEPVYLLERFENLAYDESVSISLSESVDLALANFRHPTGLHTYKPAGCGTHSRTVLMPPGLTRQSQLEFYRDLHQRVFDTQIAYWNLSIARARVRSVERQNALSNRLLDLIRQKQSSDQATIKDANAAKLKNRPDPRGEFKTGIEQRSWFHRRGDAATH